MKRVGIKTKFLTCFILMSVVLLVISLWILTLRLNKITEQRIDNEFESIMSENKSGFDAIFQVLLDKVNYIRFNEGLMELLMSDVDKAFDINRNIQLFLNNVSLFGTTLSSSRDIIYVNKALKVTKNMLSFDISDFSQGDTISVTMFSTKNIEDKDWFKKTLQSDGLPYIFRNSDSSIVYHAVVIYDGNDRSSEYIAVKVDGIDMRYVMNSMTLLDSYGQELAFLDNQNRIICKTSDDIPDEYFISPAEGYKCKSVTTNTGFIISSIIPQNDITVSIGQIKDVLGICIILGIILSIILGYIISYVLTKPIIRLSAAMKNIDISDSFYELKNGSSDEIGDLYRAFNDMIVCNKKLFEQIERETELRHEMEFKLYQSRINPHMLYNTLDSISWMALLAGQDKIADMNNWLADIYRYSVRDNTVMATVGDEIECVKNYINIQRVRYERNIVFKTDIYNECSKALVPKCILQPLVENSVIHGIDTNGGDFIIEIKAEGKNGVCTIFVADNGKKGDLEKINKLLIHPDNTKIGINNVNSRLKLKYGEEFALRYEKNHMGGITVVVAVPLDFGGKTE